MEDELVKSDMNVEEKNENVEDSKQPESMDNELQVSRSMVSATPNLAKSLSIRSNSLIERLFFGHLTSEYLVGDNQEVVAGEDSMFGPILLDPTTGYFYKSWENYFYNFVDEFRETRQKAAKWDLVKRFPDILCFQIQRARYNTQRKCAEKNNQRFEFDQEIYVDRFLHRNMDTVKSLKARADALEKERLEIDIELKAISGFRENRDIIKSLDDVLHLLQVLNSPDGEGTALPPSILNHVIQNKPEVAAALSSLRTGLEEEKKTVTARRQAIESETKTLYSGIEKTKYVIFSIIIHEGSADSGHFYCFVRMQDKWFKFNDFFVREMDETEVYETAYGFEGSAANAYCVFYMEEEMWKKCPPHNFAMLGENSEGYYEFVPQDKLFNIKQANMSYNKEIYSSQIKKINAEYITRHDFVLRNYADRYKEWANKAVGMRSVCDFFISRSLLTSAGEQQRRRSRRRQITRQSLDS
jgi:hypothetical protein